MMIPRHELIMARLGDGREVSVSDLATALAVTPVTIRRDLDALQEEGLVERTHGGAVLAQRGRIEFSFRRREESMAGAKQAIARAVAGQLRSGMSVTFDTGTTTLAVARAVAVAPPAGLQVLTSSLPVAAVLHPVDGIDVVLLGGQLRDDEPDLFGELTEANLARFQADLAILGTDGADRQGLMTTDPAIARVSEAMIRHSRRHLLVADHTKFAATAFKRFATWDDIDAVVTDRGLPAAARQWLSQCTALTVAEGR